MHGVALYLPTGLEDVLHNNLSAFLVGSECCTQQAVPKWENSACGKAPSDSERCEMMFTLYLCCIFVKQVYTLNCQRVK